MKKLGKLETTTHGPHVSLCSTMLLFWMSVLKFWNAESWIPWFPWVKPLGFQAPNKSAVLVVSPQCAPSMPCFLGPIAFFWFIIWEEEMTIFIEETNIWTRSQGGDIFNCTKNRNPRRNAARNQSMTATIFTQATWVLKVKGAPGRFASHHEHWLQDHVTCWC